MSKIDSETPDWYLLQVRREPDKQKALGDKKA